MRLSSRDRVLTRRRTAGERAFRSIPLEPDTDGFYIEDDGPGIPAEEREKVFNAGYLTAESGTGLGLNIVKRVAEAHGWEINITESSLGGTRFEITGIEAIE